MFREIRTSEKLYNKKEEKAYMNIKPEVEMTEAELNAAVMDIFNQVAKENQ